jgi:hypothetical protein
MELPSHPNRSEWLSRAALGLILAIFPAALLGRKGIDDVLGEHDHLARMGTRMNNIFWIIGVIVVVIAVLGFFGLR